MSLIKNQSTCEPIVHKPKLEKEVTKMSKMGTKSFLLGILMIFCFYGLAFSGGGPDPTGNCPDPLPPPDSGRFIRGEYTVARDKGECSVSDPEGCAHYNVHLILKFQKHTHLFSFPASLGTGNICAYTAEALKENFRSVACDMGIGDKFGLLGIPVIASLTIEQQDFCIDEYDQMIRGEVLIRVVPIE
jgi:hypothetical protein